MPRTPTLALDLRDLLAFSKSQLAGTDIAELNLRCAEGLPGAEDLDVGVSLRQLDEWAEAVRTATTNYLHLFYQAPKSTTIRKNSGASWF